LQVSRKNPARILDSVAPFSNPPKAERGTSKTCGTHVLGSESLSHVGGHAELVDGSIQVRMGRSEPNSLLQMVTNEEWRVLGEQDCQMKWGSLEKRDIAERQLRASQRWSLLKSYNLSSLNPHKILTRALKLLSDTGRFWVGKAGKPKEFLDVTLRKSSWDPVEKDISQCAV